MILRRQAGDIIDKINTKRGDQSSTTRNWQRVAKSEEAKRKLFIDFTTNRRKNFYGREKRETRKQKFLSKRKSFAMKFYFFPISQRKFNFVICCATARDSMEIYMKTSMFPPTQSSLFHAHMQRSGPRRAEASTFVHTHVWIGTSGSAVTSCVR